jgi:hypothetical protein
MGKGRVLAALLAAVGLLSIGLPASAGSPPRTQAITVTGPGQALALALAGGHAFWTEDFETPAALYTDRGGKPTAIWHGRDVAIPPDLQGPDSSIFQEITSIGASRSMIAFLYSAFVLNGDLYNALFSELWAGPPNGPFTLVAGGASPCPQAFVTDAAVSGRRVAFDELRLNCDGTPAASSVELASLGGGAPQALTSTSSGLYSGVALAGNAVAWELQAYSGPNSIAVQDTRTRRLMFRLGQRFLNASGRPTPFDVRSDGTIALEVERPQRCPGGAMAVAWASPKEPRLHFVSHVAWSGLVRIAGSRILFVNANPGCKDVEKRLILSDLKGKQHVVARDQNKTSLTGEFDLETAGLAYSTFTPAAADGLPETIYLRSPP